MLHTVFSFYHMIHPKGFEIHRPNGLKNYLFVLFNTPAEVCLNNRWIPAINRFIIFEPGKAQWYRSVGDKPFSNDFIDFMYDDTQEATAFFEKIGIPLNLPVPCNDVDWVGQTIQRLSDVRLGPAMWRNEIAANELTAMFYRLSVALKLSGNNATNRYLHAFYKLRSTFYSAPQSDTKISQLAVSMRLSQSHFQSLYKAYFSVSVGADIIQGRLEYARHLLSVSDESINSIAQQCGYENPEHFIRQFKKSEGVTPGKYRRNANALMTEESD